MQMHSLERYANSRMTAPIADEPGRIASPADPVMTIVALAAAFAGGVAVSSALVAAYNEGVNS